MYKKTTFKNNLRLIEIPLKSTKAVTILILVRTGSSYETRKENGISHFVEHMFFKGTKKRPSPIMITEEIDRVGGMNNAFTGKEATGYWVKVESSYLDLALDWISDIFLNSQINEKELNKEKGVILQEINMYLDTPSLYIEDLWEKVLYGDQPAGWSTLGPKENIKRFRRKDLLTYIRKHYSSRNTVISIAGNIKEGTRKKVEEYFRSIRNFIPPRKKEVRERQRKPEILILNKKTDQVHLALGVKGYPLGSPERFTQGIIAKILGGFMSSRIFMEIREKRGLAYYVRTESETYPDRGYLVTFAGIDKRNVENAIKVILEEYRKIREEKVSERELKKAKDNFQGRLFLSLESSDALASFYGSQELFEKKILAPDEVIKKIEKITPQDIQSVASEIFRPEKLNLALIGPFKGKTKFKEILKI